MAKDDYHVIAYKILTFYYSCLQGKTEFDESVLFSLVQKDELNDGYWIFILRSLCQEGYLDGICFTKAWGDIYILTGNLEDGVITVKGIEYIKENSTMQKVRSTLTQTPSLIASLIKLVFGN